MNSLIKHSITQSLNHLITLVVFQGVAWACPMCKEALFDPNQAAAQSGVVRGYAVSIAAMLGVPALLMGAMGFVIARSARRARH
ncbi:MAG: hypothetical protein HY595_02535 [Candidatus Omnitrophica bacterium]|nr:hypothetical protein [Candidatus Omnitrophota bacterium]